MIENFIAFAMSGTGATCFAVGMALGFLSKFVEGKIA